MNSYHHDERWCVSRNPGKEAICQDWHLAGAQSQDGAGLIGLSHGFSTEQKQHHPTLGLVVCYRLLHTSGHHNKSLTLQNHHPSNPTLSLEVLYITANTWGHHNKSLPLPFPTPVPQHWEWMNARELQTLQDTTINPSPFTPTLPQCLWKSDTSRYFSR